MVSLWCKDQTAGNATLPASSWGIQWVIQVRTEGRATHQDMVLLLRRLPKQDLVHEAPQGLYISNSRGKQTSQEIAE